MENVHISIPELGSRALTYESFFRVMVILLKHEQAYLQERHPSESIDDIEAYPLQIVRRIIKTSCTLHSVIERDEDYVVANTIVRSIADTLSSLLLIYKEKDIEERKLRHYLYIMDGVKERIKRIPDNLKYDGKIKKEEYDKLCQQVKNSKASYQGAYDNSVSIIKSLSLYNGRKAVINELICYCNWRYKSLGTTKSKYSWEKMYDFISLNNGSSFFSCLSEFVHGLSTSNMSFELGTITFEPVYGTATALSGKLWQFLEEYYSQDIPFIRPRMMTALIDEGMPQNYIKEMFSQIVESK